MQFVYHSVSNPCVLHRRYGGGVEGSKKKNNKDNKRTERKKRKIKWPTVKLKEGGKIYTHMYLAVCSDPPTSGSTKVFCLKKIKLWWEGEIRHTQKLNPSPSLPDPSTGFLFPHPLPEEEPAAEKGKQLKTLVSREENNKRTGPRKQRLKDGRHSADETERLVRSFTHTLPHLSLPIVWSPGL